MTCKFCNAWRPKQSIFLQCIVENHTSHGKMYSSSVLFCVSLHFLHCAPKNQTSRRRSLPLQNKHSYFCTASNLWIISAIFTLLRKTVFCSVKNCNDLASFGCILEQCNFYTTFLIVLKSGTTSEDTTSEQNRVHEGTSALQPRHTDARATPHMTPTPKDPDSFASWSDADVLQVLCGTHHFHKWASVVFLARWQMAACFVDPVCTFTRCQPFAFGVLRVIMSEPSPNVQMIGCRARVGTHMPVGRPCWVSNHPISPPCHWTFPVLFFNTSKEAVQFFTGIAIFYNARKSVFSGSVIFTSKNSAILHWNCNFYTAL